MDYYINANNATKDDYLRQPFHPRTDEFLPQLHIIRTIYDHIDYLNDYRAYLCENYDHESETFKELNYCLIKWIGEYLQLYRVYWFDKLKQTLGEYNNNVWLDLKYLYALIVKDDKKIGRNIKSMNNKYITIGRRIHGISRSEQNNPEYADIRISEKILLEKPMLLQ